MATTPTLSPNNISYSFDVIDVPFPNANEGLTFVDAVNDRGDLAVTVGPGGPFGANFDLIQGTKLTQIGVGPTSPRLTGINNQDVVIGYSVNANHGFINSITPFVSGGNGILPTDYAPAAINNQGEIVGTVHAPMTQLPPGFFSLAPAHGFTFQHGVLTTFDVPGASVTIAQAVNDKGDIAGSYDNHGFLDIAGRFTTIDYPGASRTAAGFLNNSDEVVGAYSNGSSSAGAFTYLHGHYTNIDLPAGATLSSVAGINDQGVVVGDYEDSSFHEHGFVFQNGHVTPLDVPDATRTIVTGINNHGEIVGWFNDATGAHGFTATPGGIGSVSHTTFDFSSVSPTTFAPPASGTMLIDTGASGGSGGLSSMSTSPVDPSLLVTPHIPT